MTLIQGLLLGLLQGLTEFLPVSSSGHLVIAQHFFNFSTPPVAFDIFVHLATALAVIIVIKPILLKLNRRLIGLILLASLPAGLIGFFLNQKVEALFNSLVLVGLAFIITAVLLFSTRLTHRLARKQTTKLTSQNSFIIGLFQALAIVPGISRSGSTITAGLFQRLKPETAFNFSFLLSLPAILGAQLLHLNELTNTGSYSPLSLTVGFFSAFISGLLSLKLLKKLLIKGKLHWFGFYCLLVGSLILITCL